MIMKAEDQLTNEKSLDIIRQMIENARQRVTDDGVSWLFWGSMIFLASIATYFFILFDYPNVFLGWNIFAVITIIVLSYQFIRPKKKNVRTYVDDLLRLFSLGFIICMFTIIISVNVAVSPNEGFGYFLMIYAFLMLLQGGALSFRPLLIGAGVNWAGAIAIFINHDFKYDMLITAAAVLIGYIIPGLILHRRARATKTANQS